MICVYLSDQTQLTLDLKNPDNQKYIENAIWIDVLSPTHKEEKLLEQHLHLDVPTKLEMKEIESSSRLYQKHHILFMTATMIADSESEDPKTDSITFILSKTQLITIRYIEPHSFKNFITNLAEIDANQFTAQKLFVGLLESSVDRLADILETLSHNFDGLSKSIFRPSKNNHINYKKTLQGIGINADLAANVRESLGSFGRIISYFKQQVENLEEGLLGRIEAISKDLSVLNDYISFISSKVTLLLEATIGMVNIEQNNIIKIFSVAAVMFLPPTLIASIYGMNFKIMPELHWSFGYPLAVFLMIISALLPYRFFKKKGWL